MRRTLWLLVEDNPAEVDLARDALAHVAGLELVAVRSAEAALEYLRGPVHDGAPRPSLMLLDLNLPGLRGEDLVAEVRGDGALKRLPIVVLSSSDNDRDIARLYERGANCYLVKPLQHTAFATMIYQTAQFWLSIAQVPGTASS